MVAVVGSIKDHVGYVLQGYFLDVPYSGLIMVSTQNLEGLARSFQLDPKPFSRAEA